MLLNMQTARAQSYTITKLVDLYLLTNILKQLKYVSWNFVEFKRNLGGSKCILKFVKLVLDLVYSCQSKKLSVLQLFSVDVKYIKSI